jgi:mycoredoxin
MSDLYSFTPSQIVMYSTERCSDCRRAKAFFEAKQIPHLQVPLESDERATQFVSDINHGYHSVPTIIFPDGSILVEPSWEELQAKFA